MPKLSKQRSDIDSAESVTERPDPSARVDGQLRTLLDLVGEEVNRLDQLKELMECTRGQWSDERSELDNDRY